MWTARDQCSACSAWVAHLPGLLPVRRRRRQGALACASSAAVPPPGCATAPLPAPGRAGTAVEWASSCEGTPWVNRQCWAEGSLARSLRGSRRKNTHCRAVRCFVRSCRDRAESLGVEQAEGRRHLGTLHRLRRTRDGDLHVDGRRRLGSR